MQSTTATTTDSEPKIPGTFGHDLILEFGHMPRSRTVNYIQGQIFTVLECTIWRPAIVYVCFVRKTQCYKDRKYIRVHDPGTCKCLAARFEFVVQQHSSSSSVRRPSSHNNKDLGLDFASMSGLARPGANVFNSIYFARPDGTFRNALGESMRLEGEDTDVTDQREVHGKYVRLMDLLGIVRTSDADRKAIEYPPLLTSMLDWPAQIVG